MLLADSLKKACKFFPRKEAIICGDRRWTYEEFFGRVSRFSAYLKAAGIDKGDRVAILHPNCHCYLEVYYAVALRGAVTVPLNYRLSPGELVMIMNDAGAKALVADPRFRQTVDDIRADLPTVGKIIWTGDDAGALPDGGRDLRYEEIVTGVPAPPSAVDVGAEDIAHIYYTSGTTGRPKGVMLTHKNVTVHALGTIAELQLTDRDVWLHAAPLFHLADAWATWAITWVGGTHVLVGEFDPQAVLTAMEREHVTITNLIPTMLNMLVHHPGVEDHDYRHLRVLLSGGSPIAPEVVRRIVETFHCDYIQTYGMTETSPYLTLSVLKGHLLEESAAEQLRFKAKTGREFIAVELRVVDDAGRDVARDEVEVGEIIVRGDTVTPGYWQLPEETEKAFKDGWLCTGDMAVMDAEGYVTIVDRKKDVIITGGENVYSTEVEHVLYMHPAVMECAVVGVPDAKWGESVKGIVVTKSGHEVTEEELIGFCKDSIARYKAPKSIDFVPALPKTGSGKIEKRRLREGYWQDHDKKVR